MFFSRLESTNFYEVYQEVPNILYTYKLHQYNESKVLHKLIFNGPLFLKNQSKMLYPSSIRFFDTVKAKISPFQVHIHVWISLWIIILVNSELTGSKVDFSRNFKDIFWNDYSTTFCFKCIKRSAISEKFDSLKVWT